MAAAGAGLMCAEACTGGRSLSVGPVDRWRTPNQEARPTHFDIVCGGTHADRSLGPRRLGRPGPAKACVRSVRGPHPNGPASCLERHGRRCPRLIERGDGDAAMSCPKRRRRAFVLPLVDRRGLLTLPNASGPLLFGGAVSLRSEERLVLRATLGVTPIDNDKNEVGIGVGLGLEVTCLRAAGGVCSRTPCAWTWSSAREPTGAWAARADLDVSVCVCLGKMHNRIDRSIGQDIYVSDNHDCPRLIPSMDPLFLIKQSQSRAGPANETTGTCVVACARRVDGVFTG